MIEFYDPLSARWEVEGLSRGYHFKGSSSSSSSASSTTTNMYDNRKAATDGAIMAENSNIVINSLDAGLANAGYQQIGNVAGMALMGNTNLANNAVLSAAAQSIAGQQIGADVANRAIVESNRNAATQLGINADVAKTAMLSMNANDLEEQDRALDTIDLALSNTVSTLNNVNEQREISQRSLNENLAQMHDNNTAYAEAVQKETNSTVKKMAEEFTKELSKNAESDTVKYVQYSVYAIVAVAVVYFISKGFKSKNK